MSVLRLDDISISTYSSLLMTHPAHVCTLHELEVLDLAELEPDGLHVRLEIPGGHVVQALCVLIPVTNVIPFLRI